MSYFIWLHIGNVFEAENKPHFQSGLSLVLCKKLHEKELTTARKFATVPNVLQVKQFVKIFVDNNHLSLTLQNILICYSLYYEC